MGAFRIGNQRIGIITDQPVLDGGQPTYTELLEPINDPEPLIEWVDGCALEVQTMSETQGATTTTSEVAVVLMPVVGDQVPLVDEDGAPAGFKAVTAITASARLREWGTTNHDYAMRNDAVLQKTIRGRADHVECLCEREQA